MSELAGRKVLVVGAGTQALPDPDAPIGNGRAISVLAARAGATDACADIDTDAAKATAALVEAEGATAHVLTADVADAAACHGLVEAAAAAMDGLDGLVCNVGIGAGMGMQGTTPEQWDHVFSVNGAGPHRHRAGAVGHRGAAVTGEGAGAETAGHRVGGGRARRVPA